MKSFFGITGLVLGVAVLFFPVLSFDFIRLPGHDDAMNVLENPFLGQPGALLQFWSEPLHQLYIPVVYSFWHAIALVQGVSDAGGFHLLNGFFHLSNTVLVYLLFRQSRLSTRAAWIAAALFAVHPLHSEPVAWVTGLKDLSLACFCLLSLLAYTQWAVAPRARASYAYLSLSFVCFLLALLCKPTAVVLPLVWLTWSYFAHGAKLSVQILPSVVGGVVSVLATVWTMQAQSEIWMAPYPSAWSGILVAADTYLFSIKKWLFPWELTLDNGRTPVRVLAQPWIAAGPSILLIAAALLYRGLIHRAPQALAGMALAVLFLLPVSGLKPFVQQIYSSFADRYQYLPLVGFAFVVGCCLDALFRQSDSSWLGSLAWKAKALGGFASVGILMGLSWLTHQQLQHWRSAESLAQHTLQVRPNSWFGHRALADLYEAQGDSRQAAKHLVQAVEDAPAHTHWMYLAAIARNLQKLGRREEAEKIGHHAKELFSDRLLEQAEWLAKKSAYPQAKLRYRKVLEMFPEDPRALEGMKNLPQKTADYSQEDSSGTLR